jgi:pimeloyl-ACP methyl ester carboxylesterase
MTAPQEGEPAPQWFVKALAQQPESGRLTIEGASIDWAAWGDRRRPGLLLLIGNGAHIGWWRPIAPFLAEDYRVATFNWSGMGSSDWRDEYRIDTFVTEAMAVAEAAGLFEGGPKALMAAHSLGGFFGLQILVEHGHRFKGGMLIDSRLRLRSKWGREAPPVQPFHIHPTREQAIGRFRLKPEQSKRNSFILDMLAAESLEEAEGGWRWRADPNFHRKTALGADLIPLIARVPCPMMFVRGELSSSVTDDVWADQKAAAPAGTPFVGIPDAHHHLMVDQPIALLSAMRALFSALPEEGGWRR